MTEALVVENFKRKEAEAEKLGAEMAALVGDAVRAEVLGASAREWNAYEPRTAQVTPGWLS